MNPQDVLSQLRDVHEPEAISWFPIAPGWWILSALVLIFLFALIWRILRKRRASAFRREALLEIDTLAIHYEHTKDSVALAFAISKLVRRVCMYKRTRHIAASRLGNDFAVLLQDISQDKDASLTLATILGSTIYTKEAQVDSVVLIENARKWLRGVAC